ncbi:threonine ammonia-lyase IlvA [Wenyingzhuangia marina]|uniref:L-threonine dehydratase n=1 Tax=Wenyingzhuangia marina TaxID=1195760 RepID=A0A1M5S8M5_9FLAO|nr:threonine ammonia-lyase IlvA [Wenyingzhuangia marina]GGF61240.1 L-threonine dehydratase [Wenyingzhuangia marina]SHH34795.1 L-threonine ammonia-lyase [Wenyingzhuangia marina]
MVTLESIIKAQMNIKGVVQNTPLSYMDNFSKKFDANIYFKREDLQLVRSYKIRGAYNRIKNLSKKELENGVVCASAGNHAQGVAFACKTLKVKGVIFMPVTTPKQKISQVKMFGGEFTTVKLIGDTFDESSKAAEIYQQENKATYVHPFNDWDVMSGQGTVALEILDIIDKPIDYLFLPIGGGGLASGMITVFKNLSPNTKIIGLEPKGAPSLKTSLEKGENTKINNIDKFVDGAAVQKMGDNTYPICKDYLEDVSLIDEGHICKTILKLYNENAIVAEPAGALSIAALDNYADEIKGKTVVCVLSGGNNDITRMEEMKERALLYDGLKHYFIVRFPQRAGALKEFVGDVLSETDDIVHFEYTKKNSRSTASAIVGIELSQKEDFEPLLYRMKEKGFFGEYLNDNPELFSQIV